MKIIDGDETPAASNVINKAAWERNAPTKLDYANQAELVLDKLDRAHFFRFSTNESTTKIVVSFADLLARS